jgi:hypothetical protein
MHSGIGVDFGFGICLVDYVEQSIANLLDPLMTRAEYWVLLKLCCKYLRVT